MKKTLLAGLAVGLTMFGFAGWANADIMYQFEAFSSYNNYMGNITGAFTLTVPTFITSESSFTPSQLASSSYIHGNPGLVLGNVHFFIGDQHNIIGFGGSFPEQNAGEAQYFYWFENTAFGSVGTYNTIEFGTAQAARLVVSETGSSPVPEPTTLLLFGTGIACLAGVARRKRS